MLQLATCFDRIKKLEGTKDTAHSENGCCIYIRATGASGNTSKLTPAWNFGISYYKPNL